MLFSTSFFLIASVAAQQAYNQILNPGANSVIQAGGGVQSITWTNLTSGNVSVALYSGSNPIVTVAPLADSIDNTGTYLWTPETWLPSGNDYSIGVQDLSGNAPTQYSPFFTVQLCSTCSSSIRSTTTSFAAETVSVSGLEIGTRTAAAFPTQAADAATASGSAVSTGVANTASGSAVSAGVANTASVAKRSGSAAVPTSTGAALAGASVASQASVAGASANAILSQTGSAVAAASSQAAKVASTSGANSLGAGLLSIMGSLIFFL